MLVALPVWVAPAYNRRMPRSISTDARKLRWPRKEAGAAPTDEGADFISSRLKWARTRSGLSQAALAKSVKVSQATLHLWEQGNSPPATVIEPLANALEIQPLWLLLGKGQIEQKT